MRVQGLEKDFLRLRQIEKIFLPANIDPNIILKAFKAQEAKRIMACSRAHQFLPEKKNHEPKLNLLHVAGKQLTHSCQQLPQASKNRRQVHSVRRALQRPLSQIIQKLSEDEERNLFENELLWLRKYSQDRQSKSVFHNASSLKELQVVRPTRYSSMLNHSPSKDGVECQQIVMKNPVLLRKVLMADKEVRKKQQAQQSKRIRQSPVKILPHMQKVQVNPEGMSGLFRQFQICLGLSNRLVVAPICEGQYKAYIDPGNNGILIRSILQSRPWWTLRNSCDITNCNLVWTEWKQTRLIRELPSRENKAACTEQKVLPNLLLLNKTARSCNPERKEQVKRLIGEKSCLSKFVESSGSNYFTFGRKLQQGKLKQFLRKNIGDDCQQYATNPKDHKLINHIPGCLELHSKKQMLANLRHYLQKKGESLNDYLPQSYHIKAANDQEWRMFQKQFNKLKDEKTANVWICKPGENSNRGNGIVISQSIEEMETLVAERCQGNRTLVIQKYIQDPLLYKGRKCDLRCFLLITTVGTIVKGYWFEEGYVRTSSRAYNLNQIQNKMVHLTNDAIQKKGLEYGRFEQCNKVSFSDFQNYLSQNFPHGPTFPRILQHIKFIAGELVRSVGHKINPKGRSYTFQLFGLDFMLDGTLKPYLIEANSNPCLEVAGVVLGRLIPNLIENVLRIAVDPIFPASQSDYQRLRGNLSNPFQGNKFQLIFDSEEEGFWGMTKVEEDEQELQIKEPTN